jgi:hypothetical protein
MADLNGLEFNDEPIEIAHPFEVDLNCLVIVNHKLTLEGISREEEQQFEQWSAELALNEEMMHSMLSHVQQFYEDLRTAANNLAVVGLITRLQHWVSTFVRDLPGQPRPRKAERTRGLIVELRSLCDFLGQGPVPLEFFADLVNVRDSVIHGDSKAEWESPPNNQRCVAACYVNSGRNVELTVDQLNQAIAKSIQQVKWFDERLQEKKMH